MKHRRDPSWLPVGWTVESRSVMSGPSSGSTYKCYTEVATGKRLYSRPKVLAYIRKCGRSIGNTSRGQAPPSGTNGLQQPVELPPSPPEVTEVIEIHDPAPESTEVVETHDPAPELTEVIEIHDPAPEVIEIHDPAPEVTEGIEIHDPAPESTEVIEIHDPAPEVIEGIEIHDPAPESTEGIQIHDPAPEVTEGIQIHDPAPELTEDGWNEVADIYNRVVSGHHERFPTYQNVGEPVINSTPQQIWNVEDMVDDDDDSKVIIMSPPGSENLLDELMTAVEEQEAAAAAAAEAAAAKAQAELVTTNSDQQRKMVTRSSKRLAGEEPEILLQDGAPPRKTGPRSARRARHFGNSDNSVVVVATAAAAPANNSETMVADMEKNVNGPAIGIEPNNDNVEKAIVEPSDAAAAVEMGTGNTAVPMFHKDVLVRKYIEFTVKVLGLDYEVTSDPIAKQMHEEAIATYPFLAYACETAPDPSEITPFGYDKQLRLIQLERDLIMCLQVPYFGFPANFDQQD